MSAPEIKQKTVRNPWKNTPTKSVDVVGTKFVYRDLGLDNGVPVIFLNHRSLSNSELVLYNDAGHDGIFQYHAAFVKKVVEFLET